MNYNVSILYITESRAGPPPFEKLSYTKNLDSFTSSIRLYFIMNLYNINVKLNDIGL